MIPHRRLLLLCVIVGGCLAGAVPSAAASTPEIVVVYPNSVQDGNTGEYVLLTVSEPTNVTGWQLVDEHGQSAALPATTVNGTVAVSMTPSAAENVTTAPVYELDGHVPLANDGQELTLENEAGEAVDTVSYPRAPEAERYVVDEAAWEPLGATDLPTMTAANASVETFVLPDPAGVRRLEETLATAEDRLLLGGYTLTDPTVVDAAIDAHRSGVKVGVVLEGAPVGGMTDSQYEQLDRLVGAGVSVTVLGGSYARYRNHHPKYAVVDETAVVLTENWKPAGTGGKSSRGWGVIVDDPAVADWLAEVYAADSTWRDGKPWESYRETIDPVADTAASGSYPTVHPPENHTATVRPLATPEHTSTLKAVLQNATESIQIKQVQIGDVDFQLMNATLTAARRGVPVEILLSSAWYVEDENKAFAEELRRIAAEEDLPISVTLADPGSQFEKIHAKGVIVDERHVVVGSLNWNEIAATENREVLIKLSDPTVAAYYQAVFEADTAGARPTVPIDLVGAVITTWGIVGLWLARRVQLRPPADPPGTGEQG